MSGSSSGGESCFLDTALHTAEVPVTYSESQTPRADSFYCPRRVLAQRPKPEEAPRVPRVYVYIYKEFQESKKCVGSMGRVSPSFERHFKVKYTLQLSHGLRYNFSVLK